MKNLKKEKGITLIALVVTIVVLLILASVSINALFGQNGLISKTKEAKTEYEKGEEEDKRVINAIPGEIDELVGNTTTPDPETPTEPEVPKDPETPIRDKINAGEKVVGANKEYTASNGKTAIVPVGFAVSGIPAEQTIDGGLVIYDLSEATEENIKWDDPEFMQKTYNQFVWIPVENAGEYVRKYTTSPDYESDISYLPDGIFNLQPANNNAVECEKAERNAVVASKGFYVGRYEAGGTESKATCKKDAVKVSISQADCKTASKAMYNDEYKASALCSGIQWDMVMLEVNNKNDGDTPPKKFDVETGDDSRHRSNSGVEISGNNDADKVYNIYDLEGNAYEYVAEKNGSYVPFVQRGGDFSYAYSASHRDSMNGNASSDLSFRPVLYVK